MSSNQSDNLKIGLLDNGSHSLKRGFEMWIQWKEKEDAWLLKESIIWVHHGIELVLKQLLVQTNEFLVFQDVNKAIDRLGILRKKHGMKSAGVIDLFDHDDKVMSVGFRNLIERAAIALSIEELEEGELLRTKIDQLTRYRNKIVHFSLELDVVEVSSLLSDILNPLLSLLYEEIKDDTFKKKVIPEILKLAQPIQKYLDFVRSNIVEGAIKSTKKALSPKGNGKAGVVVQTIGSGLSISLLMYLKAVRELEVLNGNPIIVIVDRKDLVSQLDQTLSKESNIRPRIPQNKAELLTLLNSGSSEIILSTIQKIDPADLNNSNALFVGYNLQSSSEKQLSISSFGTCILFTNILSPRTSEFYGDTIGVYDFQQAILDDVVKPVKIEKIELPIEEIDYKKLLDLEISEFSNGFDNLHKSLHFLSACAGKIVQHFECRQAQLQGKAIIIVKNLEAGRALLEFILELRPHWREDDTANKVVSTISSADSFDQTSFILSTFQDQHSSLSLLIATGSYLVGYDNRNINTIYVTSPISDQLQHRVAGLVSRYEHGNFAGTIVDFIDEDWFIGKVERVIAK